MKYGLSRTASCQLENKPLEIYLFIDPFCSDCWYMTPIIKKLGIEYGSYFRIKHVLSGQLSALNLNIKRSDRSAHSWRKTASKLRISEDERALFERSPHLASIGIKAAELQGKKAGTRFFHKLQQKLFMEQKNISDIQTMVQCAAAAKLDAEEFMSDLFSNSTVKAFQCDINISAEMEITEIPSLVFFNEHIEDEGLKISGIYPYDIYVQIISQMLEEEPIPAPLPPIEDFLKENIGASTKEIALIYDMSFDETERKLKKLILQQKISKVNVKNGIIWTHHIPVS